MNTKEIMQALLDGKTLTWVNVIDGRWGTSLEQYFIQALPSGEVLHTKRVDEIPQLRSERWEIFEESDDQYSKGLAEAKLLRDLKETEEDNG